MSGLFFSDSRTSQRPIEIDSASPYAAPALQLSLWSGSYSATVYLKIYPQGCSYNKARWLFHFDQIPVSIDPLDTTAWKRIENSDQDTVYLYSQVQSKPYQAPIKILKPIKEIKFMYAVYYKDWWLCTSIDSHIGYLLADECYKLGFPAVEGDTFELGDDY